MSDKASLKPYFIRALYEWCTDYGYTPYLAVIVNDDTSVPLAHVRDGQITLNISDQATHNLVLDNEYIGFQARFGGVMEEVYVPMAAVAAIYPREQVEVGMQFVLDISGQTSHQPEPPVPEPAPVKPARKSHLRLVE